MDSNAQAKVINAMLSQLLAGHYKVVKRLGEGGFCQTYLAADEHLPGAPLCVVKRLKARTFEPNMLATARRLFESEAKVLQQVGHHPQIPRLLAHFEENQEFFLVEEFIEGHDLTQELMPGKKFDEPYVLKLLGHILNVLEHVHTQKVIHRDIKPSNLIRCQKDGQIALIDFGAVKQQVSTQLLNGRHQSHRTVGIGSPGYTPSEQLQGHPQLSSDIYAVGVIAIQALTGISPEQDELSVDPVTGELVWREDANVSDELATILEKMVLFDYRQRYASATEVLEAIQNLPCQSNTVALTSFPSFAEMPPTETSTPLPSPSSSSSLPSPSSSSLPLQSSTIAQQPETSLPAVPQEPSQVSSADPKLRARRFKLSKTNVGVLGSLVVALVGGGIISVASPHVHLLCGVLNNCSREIQFQTVYEQAMAEAESVSTAADKAKTIEDLQTSHDRLEDAIATLNTIPKDVKVYAEAQKVLPQYQTQLKTLKTQLTKEIAARDKLNQAESIASKALKQPDKSDSIAELEDGKAQWQQALEHIETVPAASFVAQQAKQKQQNYNQQVKKINDRIATLNAAARQRQREQAAALSRPLGGAAQPAPAQPYNPPSYNPPSYSQGSPSSAARAPAAPAPVQPAPAPAQPPPSYSSGSRGASPQDPVWGPPASSSDSSSGSQGASPQDPVW